MTGIPTPVLEDRHVTDDAVPPDRLVAIVRDSMARMTDAARLEFAMLVARIWEAARAQSPASLR